MRHLVVPLQLATVLWCMYSSPPSPPGGGAWISIHLFSAHLLVITLVPGSGVIKSRGRETYMATVLLDL